MVVTTELDEYNDFRAYEIRDCTDPYRAEAEAEMSYFKKVDEAEVRVTETVVEQSKNINGYVVVILAMRRDK